MYYNLKYEDFQNAVNEKFELLGFDQKYVVEIVSVTDRKIRSDHEQFSILFQSPKDFLLNQSIYRMKNEKLGEGEIFIVPVEENESGYLYEAVFNRRVKN